MVYGRYNLFLSFVAYEVTSQSVIYVSRVDGNDSTTCGSQESPCYSISQAVSQAHFGSSIYLDSTNTTMSPYDCRSLPLLRQNWIVDGTQSPIAIDINFTGIAFENSRLHFIETTVAVKHCVFSNAETLVMNFTIVHRNLTYLVFKDVRFEANEACVSVTSSSVGTEHKQFIGIHIDDSVFNNNGRRFIPIVPSLSWTILGVDTSVSHFVNVEMTNVSFQGNYARTSGMIFVKNEVGRTKFLMQDVNFTHNGLHDNTAANSLIILRSSIVSFVISQSHVKKSKHRFVSIYSTQTAFNVSHMIMYDFNNFRSSLEQRGGAFYIESDLTKLLIKHCYFANGVAYDHGGLLFVLTHNASLLIENSTALNLKSVAGGGVLSAMSYSQSNSIRFSNSKEAPEGALPVTKAPANESSGSYFMLIASHVRFIGNSAAGPGGAVYVKLNFSSTLVFNNVTFRNNLAQGGDGGGAICAGCDNNFLAPFDILIVQCRFENNYARGGGAIDLRGRDGVFVMEHSFFRSNVASNNPGGAIKLQTWKFKTNFVNATFVNNNSTDAAGGAVYLDIHDQSKVNIDHAKFEQNVAIKSLGAGLAIFTSGDVLKESGCDGKTWRSWNYSNLVKVKNTSFINNTAGSGGGAVSMTDGMVNFTTCTFIGNAANQGSHIINYGTNSLSLVNSTFFQDNSNFSSALIETFSAGPLLLHNTTVSLWGVDLFKKTLFTVSRGGLVELDQFTSIICPSGMSASWKNLSLSNWINRTCTFDVTALHLECKACESGKYSLQRGYTEGFKVQFFQDLCLLCPEEADCSYGILTFNFWGYINTESLLPTLNLVVCPDEYWCYGSQTPDGFSNSCLENRKDWMCGRCASGYSEKLFSSDCKKSEDCNGTWFWLMFLAFVLVMALFLVFKPPIVAFASQQAFWFKKYCRTKKRENVVGKTEPVAARQAGENESTFPVLNQEIENENSQAAGFLEIIFYFYQISNLLTFSSFDRSLHQMVNVFLGIFNFRGTFFAHDSLECPFPGLSPETKQLFKVVPVFGTLGAIYLIYAVHFIMSKIFHSATPTLGRYMGATVETILLGYIKIAIVSLSLIRCVPVGNESRWFYNGTIVCYQWWQKVLIAFDVMVVVPFIFVLAWGAVKLHREKVSAKHFLLACVFPLPFLILWVLQSLGFCSNQRQHAQSTEYTKALRDVLLAPFREPATGKTGALYWQSVLILRRFVLVFLYCFINDQYFRLVIMGIVCVLSLMHHLIVKPFRKNSANTTETVSLLALVILANINSYNPYDYASFQEGDKASIWVETILLGFLPAIFVVMLVFLLVSLLTRLIFVICSGIFAGIQRGLKRSNERVPLLRN